MCIEITQPVCDGAWVQYQPLPSCVWTQNQYKEINFVNKQEADFQLKNSEKSFRLGTSSSGILVGNTSAEFIQNNFELVYSPYSHALFFFPFIKFFLEKLLLPGGRMIIATTKESKNKRIHQSHYDKYLPRNCQGPFSCKSLWRPKEHLSPVPSVWTGNEASLI